MSTNRVQIISIFIVSSLWLNQPVISKSQENPTHRLNTEAIIDDSSAEDTHLPYANKHLLTYEDSNKQTKNESALRTKNDLKTYKENESTTNDAKSVIGTVFNTKNDNKTLARETEDAVPISRVQENVLEINNNNSSSALNSHQVVVRKLRTTVNFQKRESEEIDLEVEKRDIANAVEHGMRALEELVKIKEPLLYKLGLFLGNNDPAAKVANFGKPSSSKAVYLSQIGYATLEASKKISEDNRRNVGRQPAGIPVQVQSKVDLDECPLRGRPRCSPASLRFRTADGTCNNLQHPWIGSAMLPMQRFLPPVYEDGIQSIRRGIFGAKLPSPRAISTIIHRDEDREIHSVTLMFMQWGQFIDHDITSTVKSRGFNGSIPKCCEDGGHKSLPREFLHPSCLPIEVPRNDPFLSRFNIGCMEFIRSAPSTRIECELGWREQINQVTPYIDGSTIYGSDVDAADSVRTFRNGKIFYGNSNQNHGKEDEICTSGALSEDCVQPGDHRFNENPGLVAMHTVFVRYHNKIASILSRINPHWSDERTYQETRRIVYSVIQHVTYREYLPVVLGPEVMDLFGLRLLKKGFYNSYNPRINPAVANSFSTAAFRFGHSLVQNSFIRSDSHHIPLFNNVSLHEESANMENIWSPGSLDRLLLGFANQPSQKRDEFVANELTNHLFQFSSPFGMDLVSVNLQRGRDHGIPPYTFFREPCGLSPIKNWRDLQEVMNINVVFRLKSLYSHVDDLDLFTAGLAEKPLKGGVVGPTFACIIAQQFANLRKGDRFWHENGDVESSLSPAQLQQIRKTSLSQIICQTMNEVETIQPFPFLSADNSRNARVSCDNPEIRNFDLAPWTETSFELNNIDDDVEDSFESERSHKSGRKLDLVTTVSDESITGLPTRREFRFKRSTKTDRHRMKDTTAKPRRTTIKKLDKVKTTVRTPTGTDKSTSAEWKYGNFNNLPIRPTFGQSSTTRPSTIPGNYYQIQDSDHNDVTYLLGLVPGRPTKPPANPSVQLNINIHYIPQSTTSNPIYVYNKKKRPGSTSTNYVTTRPTLTHTHTPSPSYEENNFILITNRPATSTRRPATTQHPDDTSYPTFDYKPAYDKPYTYLHQTVKPTYFLNNMEYATTNGLKRPNSNGLGIASNSHRPRPSLEFTQLSNSGQTSTYYNEDHAHYTPDNDKEPVYISSGTNYYRPTVFENIPFSSSNIPSYPNSYHSFETKKPNYQSTFEDYDESVIVGGNNNRDETSPSDDISNEFFDRYDQDVKDTNRASAIDLKPGVVISDKLDFKSRILDQSVNSENPTDAKKFIKLGVVKKVESLARVGNDPIKGSSRRLKRVRVLDVDVTPSESSGQWKFFNSTEEDPSTREVPELPMNVPCSFEVPKPMIS
ncbi:hypothetical protein HUJ05_009955 [Dendroctonus ponderosae]|nr:hypothetical protein HUJ05_009955 [Dendroctonus ponderosae]